MPVRSAHAAWSGGLKGGEGRMKMASGAYEGRYSFGSRFEESPGTNPEELIAAAHAGCFSMALSGILEREGHPPERIETTARVHLEKQADGFRVTRIELVTQGSVPGIDDGTFRKHAEQAKEGCPISQLLQGGAEISVEARLA
jgi:lipoyl-dependent peroxiredoxin